MWKAFILCSLSLFLLTVQGCNQDPQETVWIERWSEATPMNLKRAGLGAISYGKRIYAIGGGEYMANGLKIFNSVEYAEVMQNGQLGEWRFTSSLQVPRIYLASVVYNDHIYVMGGEGRITFYSGAPNENPPALLDTTERARILSDGRLGNWRLEQERMHTPRRGGELFVHNGWLYALGGFNGAFLKDVERARIQPDGSLGEWVREKNPTKSVRYISGYAQHGNRLYLFGGHLHSPEMAMATVETVKVSLDSSLAEWKETTSMNTRRFLNSSIRMGNTLYAIGGQNTVTLTSTERSDVMEDGKLSPWIPDTPLNTPRRAAGAVRVDKAIFILGGMNGPIGQASPVHNVEFATKNQSKALGHWVQADSPEHNSYKHWKNSIPLDSQAHLRQALDLLPHQRYESVLFNTSEAIRIDPSNFQAYNIQGDA